MERCKAQLRFLRACYENSSLLCGIRNPFFLTFLLCFVVPRALTHLDIDKGSATQRGIGSFPTMGLSALRVDMVARPTAEESALPPITDKLGIGGGEAQRGVANDQTENLRPKEGLSKRETQEPREDVSILEQSLGGESVFPPLR